MGNLKGNFFGISIVEHTPQKIMLLTLGYENIALLSCLGANISNGGVGCRPQEGSQLGGLILGKVELGKLAKARGMGVMEMIAMLRCLC